MLSDLFLPNSSVGHHWSFKVCLQYLQLLAESSTDRLVHVIVCMAQKHELNLSVFWSACQVNSVVIVSTCQKKNTKNKKPSVFCHKDETNNFCPFAYFFITVLVIFLLNITFVSRKKRKKLLSCAVLNYRFSGLWRFELPLSIQCITNQVMERER